MRLQAEQAGPGGGADNGFHLRGRPEPQRPAAAERTSPRAGSGCGLRLPRGGPGGKGKEGALGPRKAGGGLEAPGAAAGRAGVVVARGGRGGAARVWRRWR